MRASSSLTWGGCTIPGDGGVPAVAVSLTGPTAAHARAQARHAIDAGADVLELRVDLLEEVDALVAFTEAPSEAATDSGARCRAVSRTPRAAHHPDSHEGSQSGTDRAGPSQPGDLVGHVAGHARHGDALAR